MRVHYILLFARSITSLSHYNVTVVIYVRARTPSNEPIHKPKIAMLYYVQRPQSSLE